MKEFAFDLSRPEFHPKRRPVFDELARHERPTNEQISKRLDIPLGTMKHWIAAAGELLPQVQDTRKMRERISDAYRAACIAEAAKRLEAREEALSATARTTDDGIIRRDTTLACTLQDRPTRTWRDAPVGSFRLWHSNPRLRKTLGPPPQIETLSGNVVEVPTWWKAPFLLPRFVIASEWRAEPFVTKPLWGRIKRLVVSEFLRQFGDNEIACVVGVIYSNGTFHFHSSDYERYLSAEYPRFYALIEVLSENRFLRNPKFASMSKEDLRSYAGSVLLRDRSFTERIPQPPEHDGLRHPGLFSEPIYRVLRGLLELNGLVEA